VTPQDLLLRRLCASQDELREDLEHLTRRLLERDDRDIGAQLVPLLGAALDSEPFTAAGASAWAMNHEHSLTGQALEKKIGEYLIGGGGMRSFGRLLARLEGVTFKGGRLVSAGKTGGVERWRVSSASKPPADDTEPEQRQQCKKGGNNP
jgi:hypothetical protein